MGGRGVQLAAFRGLPADHDTAPAELERGAPGRLVDGLGDRCEEGVDAAFVHHRDDTAIAGGDEGDELADAGGRDGPAVLAPGEHEVHGHPTRGGRGGLHVRCADERLASGERDIQADLRRGIEPADLRVDRGRQGGPVNDATGRRRGGRVGEIVLDRERGVHGASVDGLCDGIQGCREPVRVVGDRGGDRHAADGGLRRADEICDRLALAARGEGCVEHRLGVGTATDLRVADRQLAFRAREDHPPRSERAVGGLDGAGCGVRGKSGEIRVPDTDARQDLARVLLAIGVQGAAAGADHQDDAQEEGDGEAQAH